ncbi:MAG: hypothetical protein HFG26_04545 [Provencibacterium sp.]|nr:hypothetical protein [Provencibacterium sp.]
MRLTKQEYAVIRHAASVVAAANTCSRKRLESLQAMESYRRLILETLETPSLLTGYISLLAAEQRFYPPSKAYAAGKHSALRRDPLPDGYFRYLRQIHLKPHTLRYYERLQTAFNQLIQALGSRSAYASSLTAAYRQYHGRCCDSSEIYFRLGYRSVRRSPKPCKVRPKKRSRRLP